MIPCSVKGCGERATHALVDYSHTIINDLERHLIDDYVVENRDDCQPEEFKALESEAQSRVSEFLSIFFSDVNYEQGGTLVFCSHHAFGDGREACPCCNDETIQVLSDTGEDLYLKPTYPSGTLDGEGCCSEHP